MYVSLEPNRAIVGELCPFNLRPTLGLVGNIVSAHLQMVRNANRHLFELRDSSHR
jgi:hypothetical protein